LSLITNTKHRAFNEATRPPPSLPKRSTQIAAQATTHIPTAKRGEYLIMERLGLSSGMPPPPMSVMMYDEIFNGDPTHM
jgi:hypothetical protein